MKYVLIEPRFLQKYLYSFQSIRPWNEQKSKIVWKQFCVILKQITINDIKVYNN